LNIENINFMNKAIFCGLITTAITLSSGIANVANAIPYGAATVYKVTEGDSTWVYLSETANSKIEIEMGEGTKTSARVVGECKEVRISVPNSGSFEGLKVDGISIDATALPTQSLPACNNGTFQEPRTANFKTPAGQVVIVNKTAGSAAISLPTEIVRRVSINGCGFGKFKAPPTFSIGATNYTLTALPNAGKPPVCRVVDGISTGYTPSTWP
jgi:hypothetical protein